MKSTRKILFSALLALISIVSCVGLSACSFGKLTSESGIEIVGGNFEKGSVLEASEIDSESPEYKETISLIASEDYDADKPVYIFEISVEKDGEKVQPKGKVKVSIPVETDLSGYDVLHIKDGGKIERLSVTYKNGIATFETDSFSKFVFVKKTTPAPTSGDGEPDAGDDDTTTKYSVTTHADTIIPAPKSGGAVRDEYGEYITYRTIDHAEGSECVLNSHCYPDYYFLGWYEASDRDEASEDKLLSTETAYTFTVTKNVDILALYVYKTDPVSFRLDADGYGFGGFSYRDGQPTLTLVSSSADGEKPNHKKVEVRYIKGDGTEDGYGNYSSEYGFQKKVDMEIVDSNNTIVDELDYSKVGQYTITYYHKSNHNIKASLYVNVVESAHTLKVSTNSDKNLQFRYNVSGEQTSLQEVLPTGRLVTLTAETKDNYAFTGWYDENDNFVSKAIVYCFEMPDKDVTLYGTYVSSSKYLQFYGPNYNQGELLDEYGNEYIGSSKIYYKGDINVNLTVREKSAYEFLGWYDVTDDKTEFLTKDKTLKLELGDKSTNMSVSSSFREKLRYIEFDSDTLADECVSNGKIGFAIGDAEIDYKNFTINAKGAAGSYGTLSSSDYTIDGTVDFNTAGTYTITYTYIHDTTIKTQIQIVVIDPENANFTFEHGYSYLDHEFDGKATFISLQDVEVNGIALYNFKSTSKIWEKLSYKWIDKATSQEVDTTDVDITINGTVVKDFGPENYKRNIGNEFCGPIKAGSYRFELIYDGATVLTQDSTISTQTYKKITSADELKSNEGSTWVNFELYYYTIIAKADNGKYYVMQMPSIGSGTEAEAREISVDANGNAIVGADNDFAFAYVRYIAGYEDSLEFMTGYYGSYVSKTSGSTVDGTWFGSPYIYRTGYTNITDGKISREYGKKENYGLSITFADNGAVTIRSNGGSDNGRLRLVKNTDGTYVFTSAPADTDSRKSFDVFIYRTIINTSVEESDK